MKVHKTNLDKCIVIEPEVFSDHRGFFLETYQQNKYRDLVGINENFVQDNYSRAIKHVLRGLHFQIKKPQGKFISVIKGKIIDVAVDLRKKSKTFGKHFKIILSDKNCTSIFIPEGFAHGFGGLDNENIIVYSCTNYRYQKGERGLIWNDKDLKINWGIKRPILSIKDKINLTFKEYQNI